MRLPPCLANPYPRCMKTSSPSLAMAALALCMLLPSLATSIANVALPSLAAAFDAPYAEIQWVVLAYLIANTASVAGAGRLGDLWGRRRLLASGIALFTAASVLCALSKTGWALYFARAAQGIGAAAMMALSLAFVADTVPRERTGRAMGLLGTTSAIGTALGPSIGGVLIASFGWPAIFLLNVPLGIVAWVLVRTRLPADAPRLPASDAGSPASLVVQATLSAYSRLGDRTLRGSLAMSGLVSMVMMATLVIGPFHLAGGLGLPMAAVGIVMSTGPVVAALAGVPAGRMVDRLGARRMALAGLLGMAAATAALAVVPSSWGVAGYALPLMVLTAHYALFQAANNTAVMSGVAQERRGAVSGVLNLSRNLGLIAGASAMGALYAAAGAGPAFAAATVVVLAAVAISRV